MTKTYYSSVNPFSSISSKWPPYYHPYFKRPQLTFDVIFTVLKLMLN